MIAKVPDSWDEVSVGQYQELANASKDYDLISILLDEDPEEVRKLDADSIARLLSHLSWIKKLPSEKTYNAFIEIDGVEYRLIENLNKFSIGEWSDIEDYYTDFKGNLHHILAMLYRDTPEYDTVSCRKRAELFKEKMMIGHVYGSFVFFSHVVKKSSNVIPLFSIQMSRQIMSQNQKGLRGWMKRRLLKNGTGTLTLTT